MAVMLKSAQREHGKEQPGIRMGLFTLRIPFVHAPWEHAEAVQALVVFVTGVSATAYLEDLFGLPFSIALAIVCIHEVLYVIQNMLGDPLVGGWITPAIPLVSAWLLTFNQMSDRIYALISLQLTVGLIYIVLGVTGLAKKFVDWVPNSVKAGILIGAGISAIIGKYGFLSLAEGGVGFFKHPVTFTVGVLVSLFLLFSDGFRQFKETKDLKRGFIGVVVKAGFVPGLLAAYAAGVIVGEVPLPTLDLSAGIIFNPIPGIKYALSSFSLVGVGFPPLNIFVASIPIAIMAYIIAFGDIVAGTEYLREAKEVRVDEIVDVNPNRTNILCGARNVVQACFAPTVTLSGPCWDAMMIPIAERYKTGIDNMYSLFGGSITFDVMKAVACFILPLIVLVQPIFPVAMSLTLMIQAFGCFYVALEMCEDNTQRGVAGLIGGILAIADPIVGLFAGLSVSFVIEFMLTKKVTLPQNNRK